MAFAAEEQSAMRKTAMSALGAVFALCAACGDDDGGAIDASIGDAGASDAATVDAWVPPPPPPPGEIDCENDDVAQFSGTVQALADRAVIAGAEVCVLDHPEIPCATTNAEGFYHLECAPIGDAAISFQADGFAGGVWMWRGVAGDPIDLSILLATDAENTGFLSPTGVTYPGGGRSLITIDPVGEVEGLSARLRSGSGDGPFFTNDGLSRIDPTLTALPNEDELAMFIAAPWTGWGELELEIIPPAGRSCGQLDSAWAARDGAANTVRVLVREGWESVIWIRCE